MIPLLYHLSYAARKRVTIPAEVGERQSDSPPRATVFAAPLRIWSGLADLLHPPACLVCALPVRAEEPICPACTRLLPLVRVPCVACSGAAPDPLLVPCSVCRSRVPDVPLRWAGLYDGALRELILALKWRGRLGALAPIAGWMLDVALSDRWLAAVDAWSPVPRDAMRTLLHGVPLSDELGRAIGRRLSLPRIAPPGRRIRRPQASLAGERRRRNLRGAFRVGRRCRRRFRGRHVLLIDDVYTTGSTVTACARAILAAGARSVRALVAAVAPLR